MAVGAVTTQAWQRFAQSTPYLVSHTHRHAPVCVCAQSHTHKHSLNTLLLVLVNHRLLLPVYKLKGYGLGRGAAGGYYSYNTPF